MPSKPLHVIHKEYKKATSQLETWLLDNAQSCKITVATAPTKTRDDKKPKKPLHRIARKEFTVLANAIVQSKDPVIYIDPNILSAIRLTIDLRIQAIPMIARFAESYERCIANHRDFVKVLKGVLRILESAVEKRRRVGRGDEGAIPLGGFIGCLWWSSPKDDWGFTFDDDMRPVEDNLGAGNDVEEDKMEHYEMKEYEMEMEEDEFELIFEVLASCDDVKDV